MQTPKESQKTEEENFKKEEEEKQNSEKEDEEEKLEEEENFEKKEEEQKGEKENSEEESGEANTDKTIVEEDLDISDEEFTSVPIFFCSYFILKKILVSAPDGFIFNTLSPSKILLPVPPPR